MGGVGNFILDGSQYVSQKKSRTLQTGIVKNILCYPILKKP